MELSKYILASFACHASVCARIADFNRDGLGGIGDDQPGFINLFRRHLTSSSEIKTMIFCDGPTTRSKQKSVIHRQAMVKALNRPIRYVHSDRVENQHLAMQTRSALV